MFKEHPKGLRVIFFTEMWERFGFYIMMAVFTLYMDEKLGMSDSQKGNIYGLFLATVYFMPIFGGWLADKLIGHINTLRLGAFTMVFGYTFLALSSRSRIFLFYLALILISTGTGLFKVNTSVLVGNLYSSTSKLKDVAYNIFYMGVNLGAFLAPIAATLIHNVFSSYNISFGAAGVGMAIGIIVFETGKKTLRYADRGVAKGNPQPEEEIRVISREEEKQRIISLGILFLIVIFFWTAFYQNGFALTLFAQRSTIKSTILKPETYQVFDPFFILILTPAVVVLFNYLRSKGREPSSAVKIFWGMLISVISMIIMVFACKAGGDLDQNIMSPMWLISTYFVVTVSELLISPIGLSFVSKVSPPKKRGLMMGFWFGATALGSYASGLFGGFYSTLQHHTFFMILAGGLIIPAIFVLLFMKPLKRFSP